MAAMATVGCGRCCGQKASEPNHKRVERLWRLEGVKVPQKQPKQKRLWLNEGSCIRLRPAYRDQVWRYDFVADRTSDERKLRLLTIIDEYRRECLAIDVGRKMTSDHVMERLTQLFVDRGVPAYLHSDNGGEFTTTAVRQWLGRMGVGTLYIEPGSRWETGEGESFNNKLRDEFLNLEQFDTVLETRVLADRFTKHSDTTRPHSLLDHRSPTSEAFSPRPPSIQVPAAHTGLAL